MNENERRLAKLEAIVDLMAKLLEKHDNCLYGPRGDSGAMRDINYLRAVVYILITLLGGGGIIISLHFFVKVF
jgi:hypothetical protein